MSVFSRTVSKAARPITAVEFYKALRHAWKPRNKDQVQTLGLAISGGVDSMALAYLCQSMKELDTEDRDGLKFSFRAYVVDHRARDGSAEEAMLVVNRIRGLGVESRVLKMKWPEELNPSEIANFESEARCLRYRLLGHACREQSIESLLLAHHADDQAETVLVRLAMGHKALGLQGIQQSADIPECWGIHGLYRSGGHGQKNNRDPHEPISLEVDGGTVSNAKSIRTEFGGISLYRPFLSFPKDRLIATCVAGGIKWVEDKTNQDPTITTRNTARQLLNSGRLPVALQKPSVIALAKSAHSRVAELEKSARRLLHACDILFFDNRVGLLVVHLPKDLISFNAVSSYAKDGVKRMEIDHLFCVSILLRQLIELVSPLETVRLGSLQAAAEAICASKDTVPGFTAGCVRFQRSELATPGSSARSWQFNSATASEDNKLFSRQDTSGKKTVWTLSRQPYSSGKPPAIIFIRKREATKNFALWDGRFWIHVQNDTPHDVCVRPLRMSDLAEKLPAESTKANCDLDAILRKAAPGGIRWTLPVVAFADHVVLPYGEQRVIALPSLSITFGKHDSLIKWAIRYKKVDLERLYRKTEVVEKQKLNGIVHGDVLVGTGVDEAAPAN
ncbi:hypothetical protein MMC18_004688 [Xylographa bjoerkii]|nr:hypothetical protein [Xylographa bjoerkii]